MSDKAQRAGLASYLGKYADQVFMNQKPMLESDEYSLTTYCRVKIKSDDGDTYQNVPLGPTEIYAYPDGKQWMKPEFKGFLDESGYLVPCHKNEKGDFEIITEDNEIQVVQSAANMARASGLPQTIVKTNYLNHEIVAQSEDSVKAPDGETFREAEAYTLTHTSGGKAIGPIEYYLQSPTGKAELFGLLGTDGQLRACVRNSDGNFEIEDENHQKQVIKSAENELKEDPDKVWQVARTDYFMGRPIGQRTIKENGSTYTITRMTGDQVVGPIEYYALSPSGKSSFMGLLDANGQVFPCTRNSDGDFELTYGDGQTQVVQSAANILKENPDPTCRSVRTDYVLGKPEKQTDLKDLHVNVALDKGPEGFHEQTPIMTGHGMSHFRGPRGPVGERGPMGPEGSQGSEAEDDILKDSRATKKLHGSR